MHHHNTNAISLGNTLSLQKCNRVNSNKPSFCTGNVWLFPIELCRFDCLLIAFNFNGEC